MAVGATVHSFEISLNDADRGVYEALAFRIARHPSETTDYLLTRVLAYCLEYAPGLAFSAGGLSDPDSPALEVRDLTGRLLSWIEVGLPEPPRLHRAAKAAGRVVVYAHRDPGALLARLQAEPTYRVEEIEFYALDRALLDTLGRHLDRRMRFELAVTGRELYISVGEASFNGAVTAFRVAPA